MYCCTYGLFYCHAYRTELWKYRSSPSVLREVPPATGGDCIFFPKGVARCTAVSCSLNTITGGGRGLHFKSKEKKQQNRKRKKHKKEKKKLGGGGGGWRSLGVPDCPTSTHTLSRSLSPIGSTSSLVKLQTTKLIHQIS